MTRKRSRLYRWFAPLAVFPTLLTLGGAMAIAMSTAIAAPNENPSAEPADSASNKTPEAVPGDATATAGEPAAKNEPATAAADDLGATVEPPQPPPQGVQPIPATHTSAAYVEHLGPDSFPGRLRGLYGGSLWLEPSFHGLQWPYMNHTGIGISGNVWVDSGRETINRDNDKLPNSSMYFQQGRGVLRVTPTYVQGRLFIQGQAELVGNLCQTSSADNPACSRGTFTTDDLWLRVGEWNLWDLKVGRFEGWEVYHLGMGMEPYTLGRMGAGMFGTSNPDFPVSTPLLDAPALYAVNYLHDRPTDGLAAGHAALHFYPTEYLRFELLAKLGTTDYQETWQSTGGSAKPVPGQSTSFGGRPTAIFDIGWFKFKIGAEYQKSKPVMQTMVPVKKDSPEERVNKGAGASAQFVVDRTVEFGLNAAVGKQDTTSDLAAPVLAASYTTKSVGGFANLMVTDLWLVGVGVNWTAQTDSYLASGSNLNDYTSHLQGFAALQYLVAGQLFAKAEIGYARAFFQPSDASVATWTNTMLNGHVRLMYIY